MPTPPCSVSQILIEMADHCESLNRNMDAESLRLAAWELTANPQVLRLDLHFRDDIERVKLARKDTESTLTVLIPSFHGSR